MAERVINNGQRRYVTPKPSQAARDEAARWAEDAGTDIGTPNIPVTDPNSVEAMSQLSRTDQNLAAGIVSLPAAVTGLVGLVGEGVPAVVEGIGQSVLGKTDKSTWGNIVDNFSDNLLDVDEKLQLETMAIEATQKFVQANPNATVDAVKQFQQQYLKSDAFYNEVQQRVPTAFRWTSAIQNFANDITGLGTRSDQMSAGDEATQAIGGAFVGLPAKTTQAITGAVARRVGSRIADNLLTKIGARSLEMVTPLTLPLTPGNIALNAAAGVGVNEAIRSFQGEDTLVNYGALLDKLTEIPSLPVAAGAAAAVAAPGAMTRGIVKDVAKNTEEAVDNIIGRSTAGKTLREQSGRLEPTLPKGTGTLDEVQQLRVAGQKHGATPDQLDDLEVAAMSGTFNSRKEFEQRVWAHGDLDIGNSTIPLRRIQQTMDSFGGEDRVRLESYLNAISRQQDEAIQLKTLNDNIAQKTLQLDEYVGQGNAPRIREVRQELDALYQDMQAIQRDLPETRPSLDQFSRNDIADLVAYGDARPEFRQVRDMISKFSRDVGEYAVRHGDMTRQQFDDFVKNRPFYMPLQERAFADKQGLWRQAAVLKQRALNTVKGATGEGTESTFVHAARDLDIRDGGKVNQPRDAMASLNNMLRDVVQRVETNEARRNVIQQLAKLPDAEGRLFRFKRFRTGGNVVTAISKKQYETLASQGKIKDLHKFLRVNDGNSVRLVEFADPGLKTLLEFNPTAALPVLNAARKAFQAGTTGLFRPAFAATAFFRDAGMAHLGKGTERSFGYLGMLAKRYAENTAIDRIANTVDPTGIVQSAVAIPVQYGQRALKALSDKILNDLSTSTGVFNTIASSPGGRAYLENAAQRMSLALEQTAYGIMNRRMSSSFGHMNVEANELLDGFAQNSNRYMRAMGHLFAPYKAMLEGVHMANRVSFWSQNLGNLEKKYGGFDKIPERELKLLERDTRNIGGDISRRSKNKGVQAGLSAFPYGNTIMQGSRHFLSMMITPGMARTMNNTFGTAIPENRVKNFWPTMIASFMVPKVASMAFIASWPEAEDWWYNKTPSWQRILTMPIPNPEAVAHYVQHGAWPKGPVDQHFYKVPLPPELALVLAPFEAGAQALGVLGNKDVPKPTVLEGLKDGLMSMIDLPVPPLLNAGMAASGLRANTSELLSGGVQSAERDLPMGGAQGDKIMHGASMTQTTYNVLGALFGTAAKNVAEGLGVGEVAMKEGAGYFDAMNKAFEAYAAKEREGLPHVGVPTVYQPREKKYAFTPEAKYVSETMNSLDTVYKQLQVEKDTKGRAASVQAQGGRVGNKLRDPMLAAIAEVVYDTTNKKGDFKTATEGYAYLNTVLHGLSRTRQSAEQYTRKRNEVVEKQQLIRGIQAQILRDTEKRLQGMLGDRFEQQYGQKFTYDALAELVRKDTSR